MRKTAMQQLVDDLIPTIEHKGSISYDYLKSKMFELLETEKQQIIEAWQDGGWDTHQCPVKVKTGTEYYNNEFQK